MSKDILYNLLNTMLQNEKIQVKRHILESLIRNIDSLTIINKEKKENFLPLFTIQKGRFYFVYQDKKVDDFEYTFVENEEILILLENTISAGRTIYFYSDSLEKTFSKEELLEKISECITMGDRKNFSYFSHLYTSYYKNN